MPIKQVETTNVAGKDSKRDEILKAALDIFARDGFAKAKVGDIATAAGVGKGTIYLYASSKLNLFKSVVLAGIEPVVRDFEDIFSHSEWTPIELLERLLLRLYREVENPEREKFLRLMLTEGREIDEVRDFYKTHVVDRGQTIIELALRQGIESGCFRNINVEIASQLIISPIKARLLHRVVFGCVDESVEAVSRVHVELLQAGLLAPDSG